MENMYSSAKSPLGRNIKCDMVAYLCISSYEFCLIRNIECMEYGIIIANTKLLA